MKDFARLLALLFLLATSALPLPAALGPGDALPDLSTFVLEGNLPELSGKVVLLDFWASWCPPCRDSFPFMDQLLAEYGERGLVVLAVSVDESEAAYRKWLERAKPSFAVVRDPRQMLVATAGIEAMPTSLLIDRKGNIRYVNSGFHRSEADTYRRQIETLLEE